MSTIRKYFSLCILAMVCLSTTCDEDTFNEMTDITVSVIDNSGDKFRIADDGQCPKEALILQITPKWNATGYNTNKLLSPVVGLRIITLTDFDDGHPAGSDVSEYFKTYPRKLCPDVENSVYDTLEDGKPIDSWQEGRSCFKALLKVPAPGDYVFRIEMEIKDGETFAYTTQTIGLY